MTLIVIILIAVIAFAASIFIKLEGDTSEDSRLATVAARWALRIAAILILCVPTFIWSIFIIDPGEVGFLKTFGQLSGKTYSSGFNMVNPFADGLRANIRRQSVDYTGKLTAEGLTRNKVVLLVDVSVPYILNPEVAPIIYERYKSEKNLIVTSSRNAIRDCTATLDWENAVGEQGRAIMTVCIPEKMKAAVTADLMEAGFSKQDAEQAFVLPHALVKKMVPREPRILQAVAEEQAAIVDLRRQRTLTAIAEEEAKRRANEGSGIKLMMAELPKDFTVSEMVAMINANANKTNAEAFMKSVESGTSKPNVTVVTSNGGNLPVAVRAN